VNLSKDYRKQVGLGLYYWSSLRKAKVKVNRPGFRGQRPWTATFANVSIEEARQKYWEFRKHCLEHGCKPGEMARPSPFRGMPTLDQYVERYGIPGVMSEKTARDQRYIVDKDLSPALGHLPLDRITKAVLEALQNVLRAKGQSPYTINQKFAIARKIIRHAVDNEIIERLPKFPAAMPTRQTRLEVTDADIFDRFLPAFDNPTRGGAQPAYHDALVREAKPFFTVAANTGLALSDLRTLRWSDIDFGRGVIVRERNKTGVTATIPLNEAALVALEAVRGRPIVSAEFVFVTRATELYSKTTIKRYFAHVKKIAKIDKRFRFHDLRHAFLTRLASKGLGAFLIQKAAGHANVRTSQRYVHDVTPEALELMRGALDR
jgi:integrase